MDEENHSANPARSSLYKREKAPGLKDTSARMTLNLRNLTKLVETLAKIYWGRIKEKLEEQAAAAEIDAE